MQDMYGEVIFCTSVQLESCEPGEIRSNTYDAP